MENACGWNLEKSLKEDDDKANTVTPALYSHVWMGTTEVVCSGFVFFARQASAQSTIICSGRIPPSSGLWDTSKTWTQIDQSDVTLFKNDFLWCDCAAIEILDSWNCWSQSKSESSRKQIQRRNERTDIGQCVTLHCLSSAMSKHRTRILFIGTMSSKSLGTALRSQNP